MRIISSEAAALLSAGGTLPVMAMVDMQLTDPLRLCSWDCDVEVGAELYKAAGPLGSIEPVEDSPGEFKPLRFAMSGIASDRLAIALTEPIRNKACTVRFGLLDPESHAVVDTPVFWAGALDQMPVSHQNGSLTVAVTAEHRGTTFSRPKPLRYTDADQQRLHPGDTCMRFRVSQSQHQDVWPAAAFFEQH